VPNVIGTSPKDLAGEALTDRPFQTVDPLGDLDMA